MNHACYWELEFTFRRIHCCWHAVVRGASAEYTHKHPFRSPQKALDFLRRVEESIFNAPSLNLECSLNLEFWDRALLSERKPMTRIPADYPPAIDMTRLRWDDYLKAVKELHPAVVPFFIRRKDPSARELRGLPPSEVVVFY